jgi:hypothetical protein
MREELCAILGAELWDGGARYDDYPRYFLGGMHVATCRTALEALRWVERLEAELEPERRFDASTLLPWLRSAGVIASLLMLGDE